MRQILPVQDGGGRATSVPGPAGIFRCIWGELVFLLCRPVHAPAHRRRG